jgi:RsmE family RNA methyltransferase
MIFYIPDIDAQVVQDPHSAHMIAMRLRYNDEVVVTDLKGNWANVQIQEVDKKTKSIRFQVLTTQTSENKNTGVLFQAMPDKIYMEKLVEVAALQGVHTIYFFNSERSIKGGFKEDRLQRIILRACELAEHYWAPQIEFVDELQLSELIQQHKPIVLEQVENTNSDDLNSKNQAILVGPEGGWSKSEIERFHSLQLPFHSMGDVVYPAWLAGFAYFERSK